MKMKMLKSSTQHFGFSGRKCVWNVYTMICYVVSILSIEYEIDRVISGPHCMTLYDHSCIWFPMFSGHLSNPIYFGPAGSHWKLLYDYPDAGSFDTALPGWLHFNIDCCMKLLSFILHKGRKPTRYFTVILLMEDMVLFVRFCIISNILMVIGGAFKCFKDSGTSKVLQANKAHNLSSFKQLFSRPFYWT